LACIGFAAHAQPTLTLDQALRLAQDRSRQLLAQDYAAASAREMAVAAGQLPDPTLTAGINNLPINGPDRFSLTRDFMRMRSVGVMQQLTRGDKRAARAARFEREAEGAQAGRTLALANLQRDTALAWLDRHYQERVREVLTAQRDEARLQIDAADAAYRGGRGAQADVFSARAAVAQIEDRIAQAERPGRDRQQQAGALGRRSGRSSVRGRTEYGGMGMAAMPAGVGADTVPQSIAQGEEATRKHIAAGIKAGDTDPSTGKKILYYHDPMVPGNKFDKPDKSPFMNMMLVPVYADSDTDASKVTVSPRIQQNLDVRTALVTEGTLSLQVSAVGNIAFNERDQAIVQARATGFVERLHVRATLDRVAKGQPLVDLYVPDWIAAQEEFLSIRRMQGTELAPLVDGARQRMRLAGMNESQIRLVESSGRTQPRITLASPISGVLVGVQRVILACNPRDWENEIHPNRRGYGKLAATWAPVIAQLG